LPIELALHLAILEALKNEHLSSHILVVAKDLGELIFHRQLLLLDRSLLTKEETLNHHLILAYL
jgi:hypothetical protein